MGKFDSIQFDNHSQAVSETIKQRYKPLFDLIETSLQPSRERSLVLTKLEESFMWVNKALKEEQLKRGI